MFIFILFVLLILYIVLSVMPHRDMIKNYWRYQSSSKTLFEKYGGLQTIQAVVDASVVNLLAEPSLSNVFAVVGQEGHRSGPQLKSCLDLQFAALFGGPFAYPAKTFTRGVTVNARTMKDSHRGLKITTAQFNSFVNILAKTLLDSGVATEDVNAVAPGLKAMLKDIVEIV